MPDKPKKPKKHNKVLFLCLAILAAATTTYLIVSHNPKAEEADDSYITYEYSQPETITIYEEDQTREYIIDNEALKYADKPFSLSFLWNNNDESVDSTNVEIAADHIYSYILKNLSEESPYDFILNNMGNIWLLNAGGDQPETQGRYNAEDIYLYVEYNPSDIWGIYQNYSYILDKYLDEYTYHNTPIGWVVQALLTTHKDLYSEKDLNRLHEIGKILFEERHEYGFAPMYYSDILPYINQDFFPLLLESNYTTPIEGSVVWTYTFWVRRRWEKTDEQYYRILTSIYERYNNTTFDDYIDSILNNRQVLEITDNLEKENVDVVE